MTAIVLAALCAQAEHADGVLTLKRKSFTWSFARIPERRVKSGALEFDVPAQLFAAWTAVDPKAPVALGSLFSTSREPETVTVDFYQPGKTYEGIDDLPTAVASVRESLAGLTKTLLERFFEFDLEFPGGTWEELARTIKERLIAAYAQQKPEFLKANLPEKIEIDFSTRPDFIVRYPAFQAKSITLAQLHLFGLAPLLEAYNETTPRISKDKDGILTVSMDSIPVLGRWILADDHQVTAAPLEVAFFNLAERPGLPRAEDVVALFEMAWKARGKPVFARVKYHPETKSIMLQATSEEILAAQRAFASLTGRPIVEPAVSENPFDTITETLKKIAELMEKADKDKDK